MADTSLHRQGVALYKALAKLTPDGADRLEMNLHDIVTKGGATRSFVIDGQLNENAIKQAWRYLASIGSVENLGPRFKRALKDPGEARKTAAASAGGNSATAPAKKAAKKTTKKATRKATRKATKATTKRATRSAAKGQARSRRPATKRVVAKRVGAKKAAASPVATNGAAGSIENPPTPSALANQLSGFQAQLEESLGTLDRLRREINESYEHLARLEDEHNAIVNDLLAFRNALGGSQRSFVDAIVGDNLWSYAPRS